MPAIILMLCPRLLVRAGWMYVCPCRTHGRNTRVCVRDWIFGNWSKRWYSQCFLECFSIKIISRLNIEYVVVINILQIYRAAEIQVPTIHRAP